MKSEFYFPSKDGNTEIHTIEWKPEGEVKAVLQMCHGMVEYIDRYDEFAQYLCGQGFYVVGNDHLGHGKSIQSKAEYGFFHEKYGNACVLSDIHTLRQRTMKKYPEIPYFMLGHSMGSILLRQYIQTYGTGLAGALLIGVVAEQPEISLRFGQCLCRVIALVRGWHYRSRFITEVSFGKPYAQFDKTGEDVSRNWLSKNEESVRAYYQDPRCTFVFTLNGYFGLFSTIHYVSCMKHVRKIRKDLPVLFLSGADDPVGNFGEGVKKAYAQYRQAGIQDVKLKLYQDDRHEILQETDREKVFADIYQWCRRHMK